MIVNKNRIMKRITSGTNEVDFSVQFNKKFYRYMDCLIIGDTQINNFESLAKNWNNDLTAIEAHFNDFLIDQNFDEKILNTSERFAQAVAGGLIQKAIGICEKLFTAVKDSEVIISSDSLRIIVILNSYDPEIDENLELLDAAGGEVKLITIRNDDGWLDKNLDTYSQPVMTIDFDKQSIQNIPEKWWQN